MPADQFIYHLPATLAPREFRSWLEDDQVFETEQSKDFTRIYLDTFDWRLYRGGTVLEVILEKGHYLLTWRTLRTGKILGHRTLKVLPRFAAEFIAPGLQQQIRELIGRRSLLPQISLKSNTDKLYLLDSEEKQLLRVETRYDRLLVPNCTNYRVLPAYVYVFPYRGYREAFDTVIQKLTARGRLRAVTSDPLITAMECSELTPEDNHSKPVFELSPGEPAFEVLTKVLNTFRVIMEKNVHGACKAEDPEYLHDFLIAARRTQCIMDRYPDVLPRDQLKLIRQDFEWAEKFASPIRDLDIYLSLFDEFASRLDKTHRSSLRPLYEYLRNQKTTQQWQMRTALESTRYRRLMEGWKRFLEQKPVYSRLPPGATRPIRAVAAKELGALYSETLELGQALTKEANPSEYFQLHQTCKQFSYQLELFQDLFNPKKLAPLARAQMDLQDNLNELHDLNLQHDALREFCTTMQQEHRTMPVWLESMDILIDDRAREYRKALKHFSNRFAKLKKKKMQKQLQALLNDRERKRGEKK
ncbi:MAG: CHAD domain-containing protein [Gammaproteobacteria bacterium]|nr:CHAD domain-containing protein [Gammaproteobacteria bacterium]